MAEYSLRVCRLCISKSASTNILNCDKKIEEILAKHRLNFEIEGIFGKKNRCICDQCWQKVTDFDRFYDESKSLYYDYVKKHQKTKEAVPHSDSSSVLPVAVVCKTECSSELNHAYEQSLWDCVGVVDDVKLGTGTSIQQPPDSDETSSESSGDDGSSSRRRPPNRASSRSRIICRAPRNQTERATLWDHGNEQNAKRIANYFALNCDICPDLQLLPNFGEVQNHYRKEHNITGYVTCCNRRFRRMGRILQHCTWHENPNAFNCQQCNRCFQDNDHLTKHMVSKHVPIEEMAFECNACNAKFAKKHLLNAHIKYRHTDKEDRPFICTSTNCEARFISPALLRLHVKKVHENSHSRVCDVCAKYFKCPESYERHYELEHSNVDQRVQCKICQHWFKHAYTLACHMRRHRAVAETCKHCGRVSKNKMTLRMHIRNMHSDIDTTFKPKNEFPCTVCGKLFAKRQTLKEHLTLHTGEAHLYECTFCSKTFRSSANMYAHRKRAHPLEYEEKCAKLKTQKASDREQQPEMQ